MSKSLAPPLMLFLLHLAPPALASDGVLEINHACATTTGCFAGDTAGYPVTITAAGSYRLTSNLIVPASTNGLELANGVDVDLGGFEIAGPISCLVSCPAPGSGGGIVGSPTGGNQCSVSNGKVRGFAEDGVRLGQGAEVRRLRITDIARHGVSASGGSLVAENQINRIGQDGIRFTVSSVIAPSLYERNTVTNTAGQSVVDGKPSGPNVCPDQLCGTSGNRLFFLTTSTHSAGAANGGCGPGFHLASLWELRETSALEYDDARGFVRGDAGQGPPTATYGWIRTGNDALGAFIDPPGEVNCIGASSSSIANFGTAAALQSDWSASPGTLSPWLVRTNTCNAPQRVWCVQD